MDETIRNGMTRRFFLGRGSLGLGGLALSSLLSPGLLAAGVPGSLGGLHFAPKARRVIYLFMSGGPAQMDLFDPKPHLNAVHGTELPTSVRGNQRITTMTSTQAQLLCVGSPFKFQKHGQCGMELSGLLPHTARIADELCLVRSLHTDPINHDPAVTFFLTGNQQPGRPSVGSWVSYGLGSESADLPAFIVLLSGKGGSGQPFISRYWGSGFLPPNHQGVQFRSQGEPVMYLQNPGGIGSGDRAGVLRAVNRINREELARIGDPSIAGRIASYEMAFRMQASVPGLVDLSGEPKSVLEAYGAEPGKGSFANNCLLARRLVEKGVRFVQLCHRDWDHHHNLPGELERLTRETDQAAAALVSDLKQRGLLEETLVVWGGEFGRTAYCQGAVHPTQFGRDHHPRCFSIWMAGGGIKPGMVHGSTDDYGYNVASDPVHTHDLHATLLRCLGVDHTRLTYRFQGRDFRLTDVAGKVMDRILA